MMRFELAPMTPVMRGLTIGLMGVPLVVGALGFVVPGMLGVALLVALIYVLVYAAMRPTEFEVTGTEILVHFPLWTRTIPRNTLVTCQVFEGDGFSNERGWGMRVGSGGLWGAFGLLVCSDVTYEMYVATTQDLVVVEFADRKPLLLSPTNPAGFVASVTG